MPAVDDVMTVDDLRDIYPGEDDGQLQKRLDEALEWVHHYAPCSANAAFAVSKANLAKSLTLRALRYDKVSSEGALQQTQTGPVGITFDNRRPTTSTLFNASQIEISGSLCQATEAGDSRAVPISVPLTDPTVW